MADYNGSATSATLIVGTIPDWGAATKIREGGLGDPSRGIVVPATKPLVTIWDDQLPEAHPITAFSVGDEAYAVGLNWFEMIHYTPPSIALGNMLSTVTAEIEIYNAYRRTAQEFTSFTNNAGAGITFVGLPTLPHDIQAQEGQVFDVSISTAGPPMIDGTLDGVTGDGSFSIPITGSRVVMFAYQPEKGIIETLNWKTQIMRSADGTEQRSSVRKNPRQAFDMTVRIEDSSDRRKMQALLTGWHARVFGVPIWWEASDLTADAAAAQDTIYAETRYGDYRVGSIAIVWKSPDDFDALQVASITDTSITFESNLTMAFTEGCLLMPLRTAYTGQNIDMRMFLNKLQDVKLHFDVIDNDVDLADASTWDTHQSKIMLDDPNYAEGSSIPDGLDRPLEIIDNEIGPRIQFSTPLSDVPVTQKGFASSEMSETWRIRQLAHALRGSQISFYLPTFREDIVVTEPLATSSALMTIESIGYVDYIKGIEPYNSIRIELVDGTVLTREITAWATLTANEEQLTVDSNWTSDVAPAEIERVSFLRLVRIADDSIEFTHGYPGSSTAKMNVRGAP